MYWYGGSTRGCSNSMTRRCMCDGFGITGVVIVGQRMIFFERDDKTV